MGGDKEAKQLSRVNDKSFSDGTYTGEVNEKGDRHGKGTTTFIWGGTYVGQYKNGKRDGEGVMKSPGSAYEGSWKNDVKEGKGTNTWKNGRRYEGEWKNDEISGEGRWKWSDDRSFHGKFKGDCPLEGCLVESDGSVYKVSYNGKSDIADPDLKPVQKMKLPEPQGSNFAKAASVWLSRIAHAASLSVYTEKLSELEAANEKIATEEKEQAKLLAAADAKLSEAKKHSDELGGEFKELDAVATKLEESSAKEIKNAKDLAKDKITKAKKIEEETIAAAKKAEADAIATANKIAAEAISKAQKIAETAVKEAEKDEKEVLSVAGSTPLAARKKADAAKKVADTKKKVTDEAKQAADTLRKAHEATLKSLKASNAEIETQKKALTEAENGLSKAESDLKGFSTS